MRRTLAVGAVAGVGILALASPALAQTSEPQVSGSSSLLRIVGALAAAGTIVLLGILLFGPGAGVESDIRRRLGSYGGVIEEGNWLSRIPFLSRFIRSAERAAERRGFLRLIQSALEQADLPLQPGEAMAGGLAVSVGVGLLAGLLTRSVMWTLVAVGMTLLAQVALVHSIAARERRRFQDQLPDTLSLIATSLRAGYSLLQSIEAVAQEAPEPTNREFGRTLSEIRLGRSPVDALKEVAERMDSVDFEWAVMAIGIQREVGGNLAEVLHTTSETMLQRNRLRREVKALTAEGRVSAIVLGTLPIALFAFLLITNRNYIEPLFDSAWGIASMIGAVVLLIAGVVWLNRIVKVDI